VRVDARKRKKCVKVLAEKEGWLTHGGRGKNVGEGSDQPDLKSCLQNAHGTERSAQSSSAANTSVRAKKDSGRGGGKSITNKK